MGTTEPVELGAMLSRLLRVVVERETPILEASGLTMWEYVILTQLSEVDGIAQTDLAERSRRDPTRLIKHLDDLEARGLVVRQTDAADRRRRNARLSTSGAEVVRVVRAEIREMEDDLLCGLEPSAQESLREMLAVLAARD